MHVLKLHSQVCLNSPSWWNSKWWNPNFFFWGGDPNTDAQLVGEKAKVSFVLFFENRKTLPWFCKKSAMIFEKNALLVCIYELSSHLKSSFKSMLEKKHQIFSLRTLSIVSLTWNVYRSVPIPRNLPAPKNIWLRTCNTLVKIVFYSTDMLLFCVDRFTAIGLWYKYRIDETLNGFKRRFTSLKLYPLDTGRKLNVHKTFRRRPGRLLKHVWHFW